MLFSWPKAEKICICENKPLSPKAAEQEESDYNLRGRPCSACRETTDCKAANHGVISNPLEFQRRSASSHCNVCFHLTFSNACFSISHFARSFFYPAWLIKKHRRELQMEWKVKTIWRIVREKKRQRSVLKSSLEPPCLIDASRQIVN